MKTAIFNFLVLQVVVWAFVFSADDNTETQQVQYASLSDTWVVAQIEDNNNDEVFAHYPSFNKLTLNHNGTYVRLRNDETLEKGNWRIDEKNTMLTLHAASGVQNFEIVKLPKTHSGSFIIKESLAKSNAAADIKYELTRL